MYKYFKRTIDITLSVILLLLLLLPMLIIALIIKIEDKQSVFYKSTRVGKDCKEFELYKFRTMKTNRKELESNLTHEEMTTKIGKILRKTSIDELPQIINVLRGEMTFIGPRPWIPEYYKYFTDEQKRRSNVLPGISGLAQIKGRNGISIEKKIEYDLGYVERLGLREDLKIIFLTIITVLKKDNAEISENGIKEEINSLKLSFEKMKKVREINIENSKEETKVG